MPAAMALEDHFKIEANLGYSVTSFQKIKPHTGPLMYKQELVIQLCCLMASDYDFLLQQLPQPDSRLSHDELAFVTESHLLFQLTDSR